MIGEADGAEAFFNVVHHQFARRAIKFVGEEDGVRAITLSFGQSPDGLEIVRTARQFDHPDEAPSIGVR